MTDGERLVWASSYALTFDRNGDAAEAATAAAYAVEQLREAVARRLPNGDLVVSKANERDFLDDIVNVP